MSQRARWIASIAIGGAMGIAAPFLPAQQDEPLAVRIIAAPSFFLIYGAIAFVFIGLTRHFIPRVVQKLTGPRPSWEERKRRRDERRDRRQAAARRRQDQREQHQTATKADSWQLSDDAIGAIVWALAAIPLIALLIVTLAMTKQDAFIVAALIAGWLIALVGLIPDR